jgi:hypothetical protein
MFTSALLKEKLESAPVWVLSVYTALTSFSVYFCMYAFRKPFTAAGFEGISYWNTDYKIWLVTAQVIGYMLSKFYGIRFISAMKGEKRAATIIKLIIASWLSLLLFGFVPAPYNIIFLLLNGFPLGMVWGLVFSFAEGRRTTEFIGAVLCSSFSLSSGVVKTVGKSLLLNWHMSEFWMPFTTGALFLLPMLLFVWLLNHVPPPTEKDIALRSVRPPMTKEERKTFLGMFMPGIITIVITYVLLTILRDFRDNFANELYAELGYGNNASVFTTTEIPVSLIVLLCIGLLTLVKHNFKAFLINHYIIIGGYTLALISTLLFTAHYINPIVWMMMVGTGLYLSYVPFNALYFERMIAAYKIRSNVGFIMYIADAFGYLGSVLILVAKEFVGVQLSWTSFFTNAVIIIAVIGITGTAIAAVWFKRKYLFVQSTVPSVYG